MLRRAASVTAFLAAFVTSVALLAPGPAVGAGQPGDGPLDRAATTVSTVYDATVLNEFDVVGRTDLWSGRDQLSLTRPAADPDKGFELVASSPDPDVGRTTFLFSAPAGRSLDVGTYDVPRLRGSVDRDQPSMSVSGGRCHAQWGRFTVHEIDLDAGLVRVDFVGRCDVGGPASYGEVRHGVQVPAADGLLAPGAVTWPDLDLGAGSPPADLLVQNTGTVPVRVDTATVTGRDAADFTATTACGVVRPGDRCPVRVTYRPRGLGPREASLALDASGPSGPARLVTSLRALPVVGGHTRLTLDSDPGDYILDGESATYTADDGLVGLQARDRVFLGFDSLAPTMTFAAPDDGPLRVGTYTGARRWPFNDGSPGLYVDGYGRACGRVEGAFVVHEVEYRDGDLSSFSASFEQHCEGADPSLRGQVSWRASGPPPARPFPSLDLRLDATAYDRGDDARGTVSTPDLPAGARVEVRVQPRPESGDAVSTVARGTVEPGSPLPFTIRDVGRDAYVIARVVDGAWPASTAGWVRVRPEVRTKPLRPYRPVGGVPHYRPGAPAVVAVKTDRSLRSTFQPHVQARRAGRWRAVADPAPIQVPRGRGTWTFARGALRGLPLRVRFEQVRPAGEPEGSSSWVRFVLDR